MHGAVNLSVFLIVKIPLPPEINMNQPTPSSCFIQCQLKQVAEFWYTLLNGHGFKYNAIGICLYKLSTFQQWPELG